MMIAYCDECGQQYRVDPNKIPGASARVKCRECNSVFEIVKNPSLQRPRPQDSALFKKVVEYGPKPEAEQKLEPPPAPEPPPVRTAPAVASLRAREAPPVKGLGLTMRMLLTFLSLLVFTGAALLFVYFGVVPDLMQRQIQLRSESIAKTFAASVLDPILVRNFLRINQGAEMTAQLPGVAYVAVLNPKEVLVAGNLGNQERYSEKFQQTVSSEGFPREIALRNKLDEPASSQTRTHTVDGKQVIDFAVPIGDTRWEAHVGVFTSDIDEAMKRTLQPVLAILAAIAVIGGVIFTFLARTVSRPIRQLRAAAVLISQGQLNQKIEIKARGEIGELALALETMRLSIYQAIERLRRRTSA